MPVFFRCALPVHAAEKCFILRFPGSLSFPLPRTHTHNAPHPPPCPPSNSTSPSKQLRLKTSTSTTARRTPRSFWWGGTLRGRARAAAGAAARARGRGPWGAGRQAPPMRALQSPTLTTSRLLSTIFLVTLLAAWPRCRGLCTWCATFLWPRPRSSCAYTAPLATPSSKSACTSSAHTNPLTRRCCAPRPLTPSLPACRACTHIHTLPFVLPPPHTPLAPCQG